MELDELLALMAATIFAADERRDGGYRDGGYRDAAARDAVEQAELVWRAVLDRKERRHGRT